MSDKKSNNELLKLLITKVSYIQQEIQSIQSEIRIIKHSILVNNMLKEKKTKEVETSDSWSGWRFL
tara:strand:- start:479 stop:676 length:198 start_codon:yes stop_codon:yes gene_type:complete